MIYYVIMNVLDVQNKLEEMCLNKGEQRTKIPRTNTLKILQNPILNETNIYCHYWAKLKNNLVKKISSFTIFFKQDALWKWGWGTGP